MKVLAIIILVILGIAVGALVCLALYLYASTPSCDDCRLWHECRQYRPEGIPCSRFKRSNKDI